MALNKKSLLNFALLALMGVLGLAIWGESEFTTQAKGAPRTIDTKTIIPESAGDYTDTASLEAVYEKCLIRSIKNADSYPVRIAKCDKIIGEQLCISKGVYSDVLLTLQTEGISDDRCANMRAAIHDGLFISHATASQKKEWAAEYGELKRPAKVIGNQDENAKISERFFLKCMLNWIAIDAPEQVPLQKCIKQGVSWCNATGMATSPIINFDSISGQTLIDNQQCAIILQSKYPLVVAAYAEEMQRYMSMRENYEPYNFDIRRLRENAVPYQP